MNNKTLKGRKNGKWREKKLEIKFLIFTKLQHQWTKRVKSNIRWMIRGRKKERKKERKR